MTTAAVKDLLLLRKGLVFASGPKAPKEEAAGRALVRAAALHLADLGYVPSSRLMERMARMRVADLATLERSTREALAAHLGANRKHEPLFASFPDGIPSDTFDLWLHKVLAHFLQAEGQPCLFCRRVGTTHVLSPCAHVVCDRCFDGASYTACPVCERKVDRASPFFRPSAVQARSLPKERVTFKLLDLGDDAEAEARALFVSLCERKQAMSPTDAAAFTTIVREVRGGVIAWLPAKIPVKENVAIVFGTLLQEAREGEHAAILTAARPHIATATDVLRMIAVLSGADASLQGETTVKTVTRVVGPARWWGRVAAILGAGPAQPERRTFWISIQTSRFKVAKLRRPMRRALFELLEGFHEESLVEDMLRHRSYWVWVGEFLHPHEHMKRFPKVARAFVVVRKKAPDGTKAPPFRGYYGRLDAAARARDAVAMTHLLSARPGELARRFDHALRVAGRSGAATDHVVGAFVASTTAFSTPVLLTLRSFLPTRVAKAGVRMFFPKGGVATGFSAPDERPVLKAPVVAAAVRAVEAELLRRFGEKPRVADAVIDDALRHVIVPFNERTASRSAVALPRGSRVRVPEGKIVRLFLHWCQPESHGFATDVDLSVGFYDAAWEHVGVCSFYQLRCATAAGEVLAVSGGDLRDAPFPDGATELVDVHRDVALRAGVRYAVMVVNAYSGMPFSALERAFAGLMLRDDAGGAHFDPRTVELKFDLQGENGIYLPLVLDLEESTLHWLDTYSKGELAFNTVRRSSSAIRKICPDTIAYFGSGVRPTMHGLALLHAAARADRVFFRGDRDDVTGARAVTSVERAPGEDAQAFLDRLRSRAGGARPPEPSARTLAAPVLAVLHRGDVDLPEGSACYALFRERSLVTLAASDLLS